MKSRWMVCVFALVLVLGCSEDGGVAAVTCDANLCPCTEGGVRAAVKGGGGPFTFDCAGPTSIVTGAEIIIDKDVELDGGGELVLRGVEGAVFSIAAADVTLRISGMSVSTDSRRRAAIEGDYIGAHLILTRSTVSDSASAGISILGGQVTLRSSTIANNSLWGVGGDRLTATNSTVTGHRLSGVGAPEVVLVSSTVYGNRPDLLVVSLTAGRSIVGSCSSDRMETVSLGYNIAPAIQSYDNGCGFDQTTDLVDVSADELKLGPLQDNGGPTMTHALGAGSVAIDVIPAEDCVDADGQPLTTDQRGEPRDDGMCDVGAVEVQP